VTSSPPLIVHLIYRLDFGGLETLLVDTINRMPATKYRHAIICLTHYTEYSKKITQAGVELYALQKPPGLGLKTHLTIWKLLRRLRPSILHTYNLATIEYNAVAFLAGVPVRIHAEHGRHASDPEGKNRKHNFLRWLMIPFIDRYVPVSADLQRWLRTVVGVPTAKNQLIHNGVDTDYFLPKKLNREEVPQHHFPDDAFVIGTVGRIQDVKNQAGLIDAFIRLRDLLPTEKSKLYLAIIGDGPLFNTLKLKIQAAGIAESVWLPGSRTDIADILRQFSVFVLPSIAEGTPVTILEAMSTGLPVVATRVGGIPEVVKDGVTGMLVPASDVNALTGAITIYLKQPDMLGQHGSAGRDYVLRNNSMNAMLSAYTKLYDDLVKKKINVKDSV
jgi:sugar transferase (PEP-CTERM/EpsH1 system associated)